MGTERSTSALPLAMAVLALAVFLAHTSLLHGFGLYEDDYWGVAPYLGRRPAELWPILLDCFTSWPQGRPLNHFLPPMLAVLGARLGGLPGAYALGAAWLTLNAGLVFVVLRRRLSPGGALAAAAAYVLFPADSTKAFLVHSAHVQGAMTFLLLGAWLWLRGGAARAASYPVAAVSLLAYESTFLPFLALPLLAPGEQRRSPRAWLRHAGGCALPVGLVAAVRLHLGESRAVEAAGNAGQALWRALSSLWLGPWTSGRMLLRSIAQGWSGADAHGLASALLLAGALALALAALGGRRAPEDGRGGGAAPWGAVLVAGLVAWVSSYALTLVNYPPTQTIGRLTSTHTAATWGFALVMGALFDAARGRAPRAAPAALVAVLASWLLYQHGVQRQFVEAWRLERRFWQQVLALVPEARGGWTVLVGGRPVDRTRAIRVNSWADVLAYRALVPAEGGQPVQFAHLGRRDPGLRFRRLGDRIEWQPQTWDGPAATIDPDRLALLHDEDGVLTRVAAIETPAGPLRASAPIPPPGPPSPAPGPVGQLLLGR